MFKLEIYAIALVVFRKETKIAHFYSLLGSFVTHLYNIDMLGKSW